MTDKELGKALRHAADTLSELAGELHDLAREYDRREQAQSKRPALALVPTGHNHRMGAGCPIDCPGNPYY